MVLAQSSGSKRWRCPSGDKGLCPRPLSAPHQSDVSDVPTTSLGRSALGLCHWHLPHNITSVLAVLWELHPFRVLHNQSHTPPGTYSSAVSSPLSDLISGGSRHSDLLCFLGYIKQILLTAKNQTKQEETSIQTVNFPCPLHNPSPSYSPVLIVFVWGYYSRFLHK